MSAIDIDPYDAFVGRQIRIARLSNSESQEILGNALGIVCQQVQKYEKGLNQISVKKIRTIALRYHLPMSFFTDGFVDDDAERIDGMLRMRSSFNLLHMYHQLSSKEKKAAFNFLSSIASKDVRKR